MLSKPLYPIGYEPKNEFIQDAPPIVQNMDLKKCKIPQLNSKLKAYRMKISGSKKVLIDRINEYIEKCSRSIIIQRVFRGHISRRSINMRGEGFRERTNCVNENDFYSLEPLNEIDSKYFFSFTSNKFTYGCNIISFLYLLNNKTIVKNPYNRDNITIEVIQQILQLYRLIKILYGFPKDVPEINPNILLAIHTNLIENARIRGALIPTASHTNTNQNAIISNEIILDRQLKLRTMRAKPFLPRVRELFMEIDLLGNYTQPEWFFNLELRDYIRLYRTLYEIWSFRGQLSREMKCKICILDDPFNEVHRERIHLNEAAFEIVRDTCLKVIENMVYCGADDEYRKIGTLHALSGLTVVSNGARNALPWLYESLYG